MRPRNLSSAAGPSSILWLSLWAALLALGWLLPNHYLPWPNFHSDLWVAVLMLAIAGAVAWKAQNIAWYPMALIAVVLVAVPFLQLPFGPLRFVGQAWISSAYLLGLTIALLIGAQWERFAPGQAASALFLSVGAAAIVSVGMELCQWLLPYTLSIWILPSPLVRLYANFGQPNLLATFLLWGLVACGWGVSRRLIGIPVALFMAAYLLFGVALTQSRTAAVSVVVVVGASWLMRSRLKLGATPWFLSALAGGFLLCMLLMDNINGMLLLDHQLSNLLDKTRNESRIAAYRLFIDAALHSPWWGYGWSDLGAAQLAVAERNVGLGAFYFHSHNLFLDLVLWCGIPLGALVVLACLAWFFNRARRAWTIQDALLVVFVGLVAWHGMTELPLHYASFLLPTGLVMGILDVRASQPVVMTRRWVLLAICAVAAAVLGLLARDYFPIEENFNALQFERAHIGTRPPMAAPEVLMLTQQREYIRLARAVPKPGMSDQELQLMRDAAMGEPGEESLFALITALALNNRVDEAQALAVKMRKVTNPQGYATIRLVWKNRAVKQPQLLAVTWPEY